MKLDSVTRAAADVAERIVELARQAVAAREAAEQASQVSGSPRPADATGREAAVAASVQESFAGGTSGEPGAQPAFFHHFSTAPALPRPDSDPGAASPGLFDRVRELGERVLDAILPEASPPPHDPVPLTPEQEAEIEARVTAAVGDPAAIEGTDPARAGRIREQRELLLAAYRQAASTGDAQLEREADELAEQARHRDILGLTRTLGTSDAPGDQPPAGWREATDVELALYGLTREDLRSNAAGEGFNAELYLPDPAVFGPDARPVLTFEGTDFGDPNDVNADVAQAMGHPDEYYERAMEIAVRVSDATNGEVTFAGHSLGGGLATAAALVTGGEAVVSNPAGVHPDTSARFLEERGLTPPADAAGRITTYVVEGDLLTGLQGATSGLSADNADGLATVFNGAVMVYNRVTGAELPTDATGDQLRQLPDAVGDVVTLDAVDAEGNPRPEMLSVEQIFDRVQSTADLLSLPGEAAERGGGILGGILETAGDVGDWILDRGGDVLEGIGGFAEWADRYLPGDVASGLGDGLQSLGDGFDTFGDVLDDAGEVAGAIARQTGRSIADVNRDLAVAAAAIIETLGSTELTPVVLPGGRVAVVPTGNEVIESISEGIQRHDANVAFEAMDHRIGQQEAELRELLL
ncbi:MAG: hypothetical protein ACRD2Z_03590 [Thermoanaerobaculia bacterium]